MSAPSRLIPALLIPLAAATLSASDTTWAGSRRSIPTIRSRPIQSALSGSDANRRAASRGNRVVIVVCAPSRSRPTSTTARPARA